MSRFAIDFGTTNTRIAGWSEARKEPTSIHLHGISRPASLDIPSTIPSILYIEDANKKKVFLGNNALGAPLKEAEKRLFSELKLKLIQEYHFPIELDGEKISYSKAAEWFLKGVIDAIREHNTISELAFTVPVGAFERYLKWLGDVSLGLQIEEIKIVDESTSAAIGSGVDMPGGLILTIDFGGGTFDSSLIRMPKKEEAGLIIKLGRLLGMASKKASFESYSSPVNVISKCHERIGGTDIDEWFLSEILERRGIHRSKITNIRIARQEAERVKISLSKRKDETFNLVDEERGILIAEGYTQANLERLLEEKGFFAQIEGALKSLVSLSRHKGIEKDGIRDIVLTGGSTLIPSVKERIQDLFPRAKLMSEKPFEAVAHGALYLFYGIRLQDYIYHSYGIRGYDKQTNRHQYELLFGAGTRYPTDKPEIREYPCVHNDQKFIEIIIGEKEYEKKEEYNEVVLMEDGRIESIRGERRRENRVYFDPSCVKQLNQGSKTLMLNPPGNPGQPRVKMEFIIDEHRVLRVTVFDLHTKKSLLNNAKVVELR